MRILETSKTTQKADLKSRTTNAATFLMHSRRVLLLWSGVFGLSSVQNARQHIVFIRKYEKIQ